MLHRLLPPGTLLHSPPIASSAIQIYLGMERHLVGLVQCHLPQGSPMAMVGMGTVGVALVGMGMVGVAVVGMLTAAMIK